MKANYKNWVPKELVAGTLIGLIILIAAAAAAFVHGLTVPAVILSLAAFVCALFAIWCVYAYIMFSYNGKRKLSKQIINGIAEYIKLPDGGICLDVGCGSGALTIAAAKKNPNAKILGIDRWGKEYVSFSEKLCEKNAKAENVSNVSFKQDDAVHLSFQDETFDTVTSNYVYHNIIGKNKQELLLETLRVLKKGGTFAIHDIMSKSRYGDMQKFADKLKELGFEEVRLIDTTDGKFMTKCESLFMMLSGSALLVGKK